MRTLHRAAMAPVGQRHISTFETPWGAIVNLVTRIYYPDQTNAVPGGSGSRDDTFTLYSGCKIYGGFDGTEMARSERNYYANRTILSGDLSGNDTSFLL